MRSWLLAISWLGLVSAMGVVSAAPREAWQEPGSPAPKKARPKPAPESAPESAAKPAAGPATQPQEPSPEASEAEAKALKLNSITTVQKANQQLKALLKNKPAAKEVLQAAVRLQKKTPDKPAFKFFAGLILGKLGQNFKDYPASELFYGLNYQAALKLQSEEQLLDIVDPYVDVLWSLKKFDKAEEVIKGTLDVGGNLIEQAQPSLTVKLAFTKAKNQEGDDAIRLIDTLINLSPDSIDFLRIKAILYAELAQPEDAVLTMENVVEKAKKLRLPKSQRQALVQSLEYGLTSFYVDNKQIDKAAEILERLIEANPERATYYNDLGFIWADHDMNLEKSETLIRKALELDRKEREKAFDDGEISEEDSKKENSSYLDSLGWVLYKRGKYEEAYKYLKQAAGDDDEGSNLEIYDHLADCLIKLKKTEEALATWKKALQFEDVSPRDVSRRKAIEKKLKQWQAKAKP